MKPFDEQLFDAYDSRARSAAKRLFAGLSDNPDEYGPDLIGDSFYVEVEVKTGWGLHPYPYGDLHICKRKTKFAKSELPTWFVVFNKFCSRHVIVSDRDVLSSPVELVKNRKIPEGEMMYIVPLGKVKGR